MRDVVKYTIKKRIVVNFLDFINSALTEATILYTSPLLTYYSINALIPCVIPQITKTIIANSRHLENTMNNASLLKSLILKTFDYKLYLLPHMGN